MKSRCAVVIVACGLLMSADASSQTQPQPTQTPSHTCPKGFQPYANRCISQRMADYISCVEASGGNSERIEYEVQNADSGKTGVGVKGSGSGMVVKGSGSVTVDRATEKALASKFEHTWTDKGMEQCRRVLDPPKSPQKNATGTSNPSGPTANAPNGIAIAGPATVTNPTVNNFSPPNRRLSDDQKTALKSCLAMKTGTYTVSSIANNGEAYRYAQDFSEVFSTAGWKNEQPIPVAIIMIAGGMWSGVRISVHGTWDDATKTASLIDGAPETVGLNCLRASSFPAVAIPYPDMKTGSIRVDVSERPQDNVSQTAPAAIAPNGIAVSGGTVNNPTVNNVTALPDMTMSDEQERKVADSIGDQFAGADVTVTAVQPDQNTRDVSDRLTRVLQSKGAKVEYDTAQMYIPPAGMTLHKGLSITSFPSERKAAVDTLVAALGDAGVVKFIPIYNHRDSKIGIVVNRSAETPEEAKQ